MSEHTSHRAKPTRKPTSRRRRISLIAAVATVVALGLAACTASSDNTPDAQKSAQNVSANRVNYIPRNDVEGHNYNARQALADQPSTILWCTLYPANPNAKPFTVPIVGKLTSGSKRPYSTSQVKQYDTSGTYSPELPGSDGFFGDSVAYRYGFDPAGNYYDFTDIETVCTTVPTLYVQATTDISVTVKGADLPALTTQAETALNACRKVDPDPSKPCPAAANILGVK